MSLFYRRKCLTSIVECGRVNRRAYSHPDSRLCDCYSFDLYFIHLFDHSFSCMLFPVPVGLQLQLESLNPANVSQSTLVVTTTATQSPTQTTPTTSSSAPTTSSQSTWTPVTSIVTLPGQTQVSTVVITPSSSPTNTATSSPLGQGASNTVGGKGLSKGAVAGLAVGIALGVTALASAIIFLLWRRMKKRSAEAEAAAGMTPEMAHNSPPGSVSRHTSQMSQSGLLGKAPTLNTRNLSNGTTSNISPGSGNRRSLGADQRLDAHHPIYLNAYHNNSGVSLEDNADYSRKILSVRNPDSED